MASSADGGHQDVDVAKLGGELGGQGSVGGDVVGVVVLVRAVCARCAGQQFGDALSAGFLPAAFGKRGDHLVHLRAEGRE